MERRRNTLLAARAPAVAPDVRGGDDPRAGQLPHVELVHGKHAVNLRVGERARSQPHHRSTAARRAIFGAQRPTAHSPPHRTALCVATTRPRAPPPICCTDAQAAELLQVSDSSSSSGSCDAPTFQPRRRRPTPISYARSLNDPAAPCPPRPRRDAALIRSFAESASASSVGRRPEVVRAETRCRSGQRQRRAAGQGASARRSPSRRVLREESCSARCTVLGGGVQGGARRLNVARARGGCAAVLTR